MTIAELESGNARGWFALTPEALTEIRIAALECAVAYNAKPNNDEEDMVLEAMLIKHGIMTEDEAVALIDFDGLVVDNDHEHVLFIRIVGDEYDDQLTIVAKE
jgi:hypothetical protein